MEGLLLILLIVILILVIGTKNRMAAVERELQTTRLQMQELMKMLAKRVAGEKGPAAPPQQADATAPQVRPEPVAATTPAPEAPTSLGGIPLEHERFVGAVEEEKPPIITPPPVFSPAPEPVPAPRPLLITEPRPLLPEEPATTSTFAHSTPPPPPRRPSFLERNPDLEKFIGENLINKIGIAILVLGLGLLLDYAIGKGLISDTVLTLIGIASGGVLLFVAHRLRDNFRAFSSVLVGGGLAVLYFSIAFAFQKFHIIGQTAAFAIMVGISALGVLLTLVYDRRELAVIALLGGFATPFMVSTGDGNYKVLFTYLLILNAGMLALANFKKWPIINILSFALTWLLFGAWALVSFGGIEPEPVWPAMGFATAFYAVFFAMILLYDLRHRTAFKPLDYSLFLLNTALFFSLSMRFLSELDTRVGGLLCVLLAAVNVVFALRFFRDERVPRNLVYLLIGIVLTFISLAAPIQLDGNYITLFWAAEGVLLVWFAHRSGIKLVERASMAVTVLMVISLLMDLGQYNAPRHIAMLPLVNRLFITGLAAIGSLVLQHRLWANWAREHEPLYGLSVGSLRGIYAAAATVLGFIVGLLELNYQLDRFLPDGSVAMAEMAFILLSLLLVDRFTRNAVSAVRYFVGGLFGLAFLLFITWHYDMGMKQLKQYLIGGDDLGHMLTHYAALALLVVLIIRVMRWSREVLQLRSSNWNVYAWAMCALLVIIASQELDHILLAMQPASEDPYTIHHALYKARTAGYPILWGVGSFLFMTYGMRARLRTVRIIALTLFGVTLVKLFLFDIKGASEGARVAAFISLGVLLLVISFLYQKLKVLLKDDADAPTE
ncbi:MAG: DUF2339 domain-containing protein [Flavobacteriales bacterium]|nr:DUF2339 domain-containing protein [Flavobacteriales bacterium]